MVCSRISFRRSAGLVAVALVLSVLAGVGCTTSAKPDPSDVTSSTPECKTYVEQYATCMKHLGPGASSIADERVAMMRAALNNAATDPQATAQLSRTCAEGTTALKASCQ